MLEMHATCWLQWPAASLYCILEHVADPPPPSPPPPSPPPPSPPPPSPPPSESWPCRTCWGGFVAAICSWWLHKGCMLPTDLECWSCSRCMQHVGFIATDQLRPLLYFEHVADPPPPSPPPPSPPPPSPPPPSPPPSESQLYCTCYFAMLLLSAASLAWRGDAACRPGVPFQSGDVSHHATCWLQLTSFALSHVCWPFAGPPPPSPPPPFPPPPSPPPPFPPPSESWPCRTCWGGFVAAMCSWWLHKGWCFLLTWNADHARDACNMLAATDQLRPSLYFGTRCRSATIESASSFTTSTEPSSALAPTKWISAFSCLLFLLYYCYLQLVYHKAGMLLAGMVCR